MLKSITVQAWRGRERERERERKIERERERVRVREGETAQSDRWVGIFIYMSNLTLYHFMNRGTTFRLSPIRMSRIYSAIIFVKRYLIACIGKSHITM